MAPEVRGDILKWLGRSFGALGLVLVFVVSAFFGLIWHLDLPAGRRFTAGALGGLLSRTFAGDLTIGEIVHLHADAFVARDIRVTDEYGNQVLRVDELRAKLDIAELLHEILLDKGELDIAIPHVRIEAAEANIIPDPKTGLPTIGGAFITMPSKKPKDDREPSRRVRVWLPVIELGKGFARGKLSEGAPVLEADVTRARGAVLATDEGAAIDVPRFALRARGIGGTDAEGIASLHIRTPESVLGSFDGYFGQLQLNGVVHVDGRDMTITLDVPTAEPASVRALWSDWPLNEVVSGHVEARGELPILQTSARFSVGSARVAAVGPLDIGDRFGLDLEVKGEHLDARSIWPEAPSTRVETLARVWVTESDGQILGQLMARTEPTEIDGEAVPETEINGSFGGYGFKGRARVHEEGMPLTVELDVDATGGIDIDAQSGRFRIEKAPRVRRYLDATGQANVRARGRIEEGRLQANISGTVDNFRMQDVTMASGNIDGTLRGPLDKPSALALDARLSGRSLTGRGFSFEKVEAKARGPVERPTVQASLTDRYGPSIEARGDLSTRGGVRLDALEMQVSRQGAQVQGRIGRLDIGEGRVEIRDLKLSGAGGTLEASVSVREDALSVDAHGENVDLDMLSRILGLPRGTLGGKLHVDADVESRGKSQRGSIRLALGDASIGPFSGIALRLRADLEGDRVTGDLSGLMRDFGAVGARWDGQLGGPVSKTRSWRDITGTAQVEVGDGNLEQLALVLPDAIDEVRGTAFGEFRVERDDPQTLPSIFMVAGTKGLDVIASSKKGDTDEAEKGETDDAEKGEEDPIRLSGIDLQIGGTIDGKSGEMTGTTRLVDRNGVLASTSGRVRIDLLRALREPEKLDSQLLDAPLEAVFVFDERPLEALPEPLRPNGVRGRLGGRVAVTGSVNAPTFSANATLSGFRTTGSRYALPVDIRATALYEKTSGRVRGNAEVFQGGRRVGLGVAEGVAEWNELVKGNETERPTWTGGANVLLEGVPLQVFAALADADVTGELFGTISLRRESLLPQLVADVELRNTTIDRVLVGNGRLAVRSDGRVIGGTLRLRDRDGQLKAQALAALDWHGSLPEVDTARPIEITLEANDFDAVILSPLLKDVLSELNGDIDANLTATVHGTPNPDQPEQVDWTGSVRGKAKMRGGSLQLATLGMQLSDVDFDAEAEASTTGTAIHVRNLSARSRSETPNISGSADLFLQGFVVRSGTADVEVERVPILLEGVSQAHASGTLSAVMIRREEVMEVVISVPKLEAKLPRATSRSVISLDENADFSIVQPIEEPKNKGDSSRILPWILTFDLGRDVKVTRSDLNLPMYGRPQLLIGTQTDVTGSIDLKPGGRVELVGKVFVIESGVVRFDTGDPSDPHLDVTASWRAPDGTTIFVDVRGTFKEAALKLRSEPPVGDQAQLQAMLLGSGSEGSPESVGIGHGAGLLNALLADTFLGNVELRTASEETEVVGSYSTYTAAVRVSDEVWFEGSYKRAEADVAVGAQENAFAGTLDWRFRRNWSLRTEVGQIGTKVDLLWRYRY